MQNSELLNEYDSLQAEMMAESCIQVDSQDNIIGPVSKYEAHRDDGVRHRAFSALIFNQDNKLLIQKRSGDKITFPGVWANTCCSHPLYVEGEMDSATHVGVANAAIRKLPQELGIDSSIFSTKDFNLIGRFEYSSIAESGWIEHEIDYVIATHADLVINPNKNEVSDYKWLSKEELEEFCLDESNIIAPWFLAIIELYLTKWWPKNSIDYPKYDLCIENAGVLK
ncbi:MAG: Isopentenyl-diphosphate Delta-isomerase [Methanobacteriota archaeon]|nr:MAG: Isopentenyl-diphosphate Delta-isomerase [Euryarchaeota archaeon]